MFHYFIFRMVLTNRSCKIDFNWHKEFKVLWWNICVISGWCSWSWRHCIRSTSRDSLPSLGHDHQTSKVSKLMTLILTCCSSNKRNVFQVVLVKMRNSRPFPLYPNDSEINLRKMASERCQWVEQKPY